MITLKLIDVWIIQFLEDKTNIWSRKTLNETM